MRTAARPGYLLPIYRCPHRPSRRVPAPTVNEPDRTVCRSCGAVLDEKE